MSLIFMTSCTEKYSTFKVNDCILTKTKGDTSLFLVKVLKKGKYSYIIKIVKAPLEQKYLLGLEVQIDYSTIGNNFEVFQNSDCFDEAIKK